MGGPDKPGHDELFGGSGEKGATASPSLKSMAAILPAGPDVSRTREARRRAAGPQARSLTRLDRQARIIRGFKGGWHPDG